MKEFPKVIVFLVLSVFLFAANAFALSTNIAVFDHRGYKGLAPGGEDQEAEPRYDKQPMLGPGGILS